MTGHADLLAEYATLAVDNLLDDVPERAGMPPLASTDQVDGYADVLTTHRVAIAELATARHAATCAKTDPDPREAFDLIGIDDPCVETIDAVVYGLNLP